MITRKRARIGPKSEPEPEATSCPVDDASELIEVSDYVQTSPEQRFSPESEESPDLDLDDFFSMDEFNWQLDKDTLSSLLDLGESGLPDLSSPALKGSKSDSLPGMGRADGVRSLKAHDGGVVQKPGCKNTVPGRINKNAIAARLNRLKKKEYVNGLESKVTSLASENRSLRQENEHLNKRVEELEDETRYLRAVLANESMLAQLLSRLSGVNGMKLSTSLFQEPNKNDHDYALPRKRVKVEERETSAGVCLHVDRNHVSVEFCTKCAESANAALKM